MKRPQQKAKGKKRLLEGAEVIEYGDEAPIFKVGTVKMPTQLRFLIDLACNSKRMNYTQFISY